MFSGLFRESATVIGTTVRLALAIPCCLAIAGCSDVSEKCFPSLADREAQGMVARGWIPAGLPRSTKDVRVRWDIDTNAVRGRGQVPMGDVAALVGELAPLQDAATPPFWLRGLVTPSWWPDELRPPGSGAELERKGWKLFTASPESRAYVALRTASGELYFWIESA